MPTCLMWGNDPSLTHSSYKKGQRVTESWVNPAAQVALSPSRPYFGWLGRGNGPVDNFKSSCISCHSTASSPEVDKMPPKNATDEERMRWFRNIKSGESFSSEGRGLDYSLQMSVGLKNYDDWDRRWSPKWAPLHMNSSRKTQ